MVTEWLHKHQSNQRQELLINVKTNKLFFFKKSYCAKCFPKLGKLQVPTYWFDLSINGNHDLLDNFAPLVKLCKDFWLVSMFACSK